MKVFLICIAGLVVACLVYLHIQALSWEPSPEQMPWVGIVFGAYFICSTFLKIANGSYSLFRPSTEATSGSKITVYRKTSPVLFWFGIIIWFILGTGILIWSIFLLSDQLNQPTPPLERLGVVFPDRAQSCRTEGILRQQLKTP